MQDINKLSPDELRALILTMQADQARKITMKVGEKGTLCVYHGGRYPIALYAEQWERLIPFFKTGAVERFIETNRALLARRDATAA